MFFGSNRYFDVFFSYISNILLGHTFTIMAESLAREIVPIFRLIGNISPVIGRGSRLMNISSYPDEHGLISCYKGQRLIAELGFKNPNWIGELLRGIARMQTKASSRNEGAQKLEI